MPNPEKSFTKVDVPAYGSCLFWAVTLAYLTPVKNDDALFRQRYETLFGNEETAIQNLNHIRNLVQNYNTHDDTFIDLVRNTFRNRVVDHIHSRENEFRVFVEGESGRSFDDYLQDMRNPNTWGGEPEIRAMSEMLGADISVSGASNTRYANGDVQIQLFHVATSDVRNHYNFGLEQHIVNDNEVGRLQNSLKESIKHYQTGPQDFELVQLLIQEADSLKASTSTQQREDFEARFQSYIDQIPSYLHSVKKSGFFSHFFFGSFSTLLDTEIAEKLNIKRIYFSFNTSKTLKIAVVKNGQIGSVENAINNIDLFSISEGKRGHEFTSGELENILKENIASEGLTEQDIENKIEEIKNEIKGIMKSMLVQISKGKEGIFANMEPKGILDSDTSQEFHEIEKGLWDNPEGNILQLSSSKKEDVKRSLGKVLNAINIVHSKYEDSLQYGSGAREAAHHGFIAGALNNFRYRHNLRVYLEQFAGRGYTDIVLLARGPNRALNSIPIIIELKAGDGPNLTPDKALEQAEKYAQGFQPNVQRVLTTADDILYVGVNLDYPSPISNIETKSREGRIIPLFQDMLESVDDWHKGTEEVGKGELKKRIKDNLERIYHTFPGTGEKGDNHYFSRFLLGQSLLLNEALGAKFEKRIFIYDRGENIPTEVHPDTGRPQRPAAQAARAKLSEGLDPSHAVVSMVLIPESTEKLVYVINIVEANRKDVLDKALPLDRLGQKIGDREIVELNLNFDTRYKLNFKRYLTVEASDPVSLEQYNERGIDEFQGTFRKVPYPDQLKETFDKALNSQHTQSSSIDKYNELFKKIGEGIWPFKTLINNEPHFQGVLDGAFSYYSDLKLQESPETRALVLTEFQTGRGERIDMLVHGIEFADQDNNAKEYTPIGLELKASRQGKKTQSLLDEANEQIEKYKEGVTYKALTDGDEVKFIGVVFNKGAENAGGLILTSEKSIPVKVVHSSHTLFPHLKQCSKERKKRNIGMTCVDSRDEEDITNEEKERRIKELFDTDEIRERIKNVEFYDQLFKISNQISKGEVVDQNVEKALATKIKDIDLSSVDPEIRDIVKEMKDNIENKKVMKHVLRRSGVAEKIGKVAEGAGLAFTVFLVGKHIANGNIEGLGYDALNLWVMPKIGEKISGKILELGTKLDSQMLRGFAPVIGRAIGNFAAFWGLAESIKARQNATDPVDIKIADLNIATSSIFIAADVPAVVTETMSAVGMEAGIIGKFAGPVGAAISVAVIIISQFVEAELEVEKLEEHINLTDQEKYDLYWDFFLGKKIPDYIERDIEAENIYRQHISKIVDKLGEDHYTKVAISLPSILLTEEKYLDGSIFRRKREVMQSDDASAYLGITPCFRKTRIVDNKFDSRLITHVSDIPLSVKRGNNYISRLLPSEIKNYSAICGPKGDDVDVTVISEETLQRVEGVTQCGYGSEYENMVLSTTVKKLSLRDYLPDCQNAVLYKNNIPHEYKADMYYITSLYTNISVSGESSLNVIFWGAHVSISDLSKRGSDKVENRYHFISPLESCNVQKSGNNFFYIENDRLSCNLGINRQKNVVIIKGNFVDLENIHSVIGSNKANHIEVSYAGYVDGKGGNDVITSKNFSIIRGYFGDSIHGNGLVLLPINFSDIGKVTHANNITSIYNKSGNFISVDKQTLVKTADGLFITPTKVDNRANTVTNLQVTKSMGSDVVLDDELNNLRKIDNSNFNITKQLSSTNYHSTIGSSSNHIFYPDKEHHNFYWEAPSNISHLYLFDERNANITIAQANGILDFSQLNSTLDDMPFIENNEGEIKINKNGLNVTLLPDYKDVTVTFDGKEYYKLQDGELERDYCSHSLRVDGRFYINGTDLLNHHNCFTFDSDKVLFLKLNNDLLLLSNKGALSISDYYSSVRKNWDLSIGLNNRIMEPEEFGERADDFSSFRYYQPDERGLQIYHNQPINRDDIGLVDFKDKSILDFDMRVINDNLFLLHKNNTLVKVENWNTYQPTREMMFAFNDTAIFNSKCMVSACNSEDVIVEFNKEKIILQIFDAIKQNNIDAKDKDGKTLFHIVAKGGDLGSAMLLVDKIESINFERSLYAEPDELVRAVRQRERLKSLINEKDEFGYTPLQYAAKEGKWDIVNLFLDKTAERNPTDVTSKNQFSIGWTTLHYAVYNGNLNLTKDIFQFFPDKDTIVNTKDSSGWTPLYYAVLYDASDIVKFLLSKGAHIDAKSYIDQTPLHVAVQVGNFHTISLIVDKIESINFERSLYAEPDELVRAVRQRERLKSLINEKDEFGYTPLQYAAKEGKWDIVNLFLDKTAERSPVDIRDKDQFSMSWTTVHYAVYNGNLNLIRDVFHFLSNKDAIINTKDSSGRTPLHYAVLYDASDIVKFLVDEGASIEIEDIEGKTPLDVANECGCFGTLRLLINKAIEKDKLDLVTSFLDKSAKAKGIDVRDLDSWRHDWKIIHYAVYYGDLNILRDIFKFPLDKVGNINSVSDGWVPLHYAVYYNRKDIISFLIDQGSSIEVQAVYGQRTPLHIAIEEGRSDIFALLISKGAKIDAIDTEKNQTPIQKAREKGRSDMVKLLEYMVSLNGTPLHYYAAQEDKLELVKFLLNNGANIEAKDVNGSTPLLYAVQENRLDMVKFLVGRGANISARNNFDQTPLEPGRSDVSQEIINFLREEQNKRPVRRKRRHHHGDHLRHHGREQKYLQEKERFIHLEPKDAGHSIENVNSAIESNQATSRASRPSSWINVFTNTIVDAVKGVFQLISSPFKPAIGMEHSQPSKAITAQGIDTNGTLFLLDVFIRKITGQKYISTAGQCIPPLEAQDYALNITERFEKVIEQAAKDSKISIHRLDIDFMGMHKEITGKIMSDKFNEIPGTLNSYVEKACPGREAGKLSPKKFAKFMAEFNNGLDAALNQPMQQILSRDSTLKASNVKEQQISLEPKSYLSDTSVQCHLTQDRGLRNQGRALIP